MPNYKFKRVTLFAGHYGSGKTNLAVNFALKMKEQGEQVKIADLDIVNPYFRTKDSAKKLTEAGIELISPAFANTNVDLPALPQEVYKLFSQKDFKAILDIGGDDRGAYALGRYTPSILQENDYEMIFVANFFRPLTRTPQEALEVMREIEGACGIKFTAIINNSNLGKDTTAEVVKNTVKLAEQLSEISRLPVIFTSAETQVAKELDIDGILPITLQEKFFDIKEN